MTDNMNIKLARGAATKDALRTAKLELMVTDLQEKMASQFMKLVNEVIEARKEAETWKGIALWHGAISCPLPWEDDEDD